MHFLAGFVKTDMLFCYGTACLLDKSFATTLSNINASLAQYSNIKQAMLSSFIIGLSIKILYPNDPLILTDFHFNFIAYTK